MIIMCFRVYKQNIQGLIFLGSHLRYIIRHSITGLNRLFSFQKADFSLLACYETFQLFENICDDYA